MRPILVAAALLAVAAPAFPADPQAAGKPVPPDITELNAANQKVAMVFGDQIAKADSPGAKLLLVGELMKASETETDSSLKYALLRKAREVAVSTGDMKLAIGVIRRIVSDFAPPAGIEPGEFIDKGNELWDSAGKEPAKSVATDDRLEAATWYLHAEISATGLNKALIEKRLAELTTGGDSKEGKLALAVAGVWDHVVLDSPLRMRLELVPGGEVRFIQSNHDKSVQCTWKIEGKELFLTWTGGFVDRCVLDKDNRHYSGSNNKGVSFRGTRVAR